jgi:hypothetical protein
VSSGDFSGIANQPRGGVFWRTQALSKKAARRKELVFVRGRFPTIGKDDIVYRRRTFLCALADGSPVAIAFFTTAYNLNFFV